MATQDVRITFDITFRTTVNTTLEDGETVDDAKNWLFDEGLKQYIKDYDPELGFQSPDKIEVVAVERKLT